MPSARNFEVVILNESEYRPLYEEAFRKATYTTAFTEQMHRAEFGELNRGLRRELTAKWEEDSCGKKDFAMMDAREGFQGWHHCGAIYSSRICCPEYVEKIMAVMAPLPHVELWTYHTACETWLDDSPLPASGEFFIRDGKLYAPKDKNDYGWVFAGKRKWWRFW